MGNEKVERKVGEPQVDPEFVAEPLTGFVLDLRNVDTIVDLNLDGHLLFGHPSINFDDALDGGHLVTDRTDRSTAPETGIAIVSLVNLVHGVQSLLLRREQRRNHGNTGDGQKGTQQSQRP